ncbi:MAG: LTA synthase family protein [Thermoanaerobaculia bacterium]
MAERPRWLLPALALLTLVPWLGCGSPEVSGPERRQPTTTYSFSIVDGELPSVLFVGRERAAELELRNDGFLPWPSEQRFFFSPRWVAATGSRILEEGFRTPLQDDVAPGKHTRVTVRVKPPGGFGLYRLHWDLQSESSGWFSRFDKTPEPHRWMVVLPRVEFFLAVALPVLFLVTIALLRRRAGARAAVFVGVADLLWCGISLWVKPYVLYGELTSKFWPGPKLVTFAVVAFLLFPVAFLAPRARALVAWCLAAFGALTVWAQLLYFRFFGDLASSVAALAGGQTTALGSSISTLAAAKDFWLVIDLAIAIPVLWWLANRTDRRLLPAAPWAPIVLGLAATPFLWSATVAVANSQLHERRNLQNLRSVSKYGLFGFQLLDAGTRFARSLSDPEATPEELARVTAWFEASAPSRRAALAGEAPAAGLNVIAIQVESMQGFVIELDIGGVPVTPNLRSFRGQALDFSKVLDQTSRGRSSAGDFVTITSLLPVGESIAYEYPDNDYFTIAHALAERGYQTLSAIPYKGSFWNRRVTHGSYGFETNLFEDRFEQRGPKVGWGINDRDFLHQITPVLEELERPFFAWLTTLSVHYPYESFPRELRSLDLGDLEGTALGNYLHGMHYFDRAFAEFLERLEEADLLSRTMVVIWSDHGSGLERNPHFVDYFGLDSPGAKFLFRRVPFVVRLPDDRQLVGSYDFPAGQVDIAPTLLGLLGLDPAKLALMGRNLLASGVGGLVVHPQGRWIDGDWIYLSQFADLDSGCWSTRELRRVDPRHCRSGTAEAEEQLAVVSLMLERDLQAAVSRELER